MFFFVRLSERFAPLSLILEVGFLGTLRIKNNKFLLLMEFQNYFWFGLVWVGLPELLVWFGQSGG